MSVSSVFMLFRELLWKAKLDLSASGEGFDWWYINVSFRTGSIASCGVMKSPSCIILECYNAASSRSNHMLWGLQPLKYCFDLYSIISGESSPCNTVVFNLFTLVYPS